jgi:hypothetical protein
MVGVSALKTVSTGKLQLHLRQYMRVALLPNFILPFGIYFTLVTAFHFLKYHCFQIATECEMWTKVLLLIQIYRLIFQ